MKNSEIGREPLANSSVVLGQEEKVAGDKGSKGRTPRTVRFREQDPGAAPGRGRKSIHGGRKRQK